METSVKQRLIEFMTFKKISHKRFEAAAGLSNGYINSLRHSPTAAKLQSIIEAFPELNRVWLLTGEGSMLNDAKKEDLREDASSERKASLPDEIPDQGDSAEHSELPDGNEV